MESLFGINEDALKEAFQIDESAFNMDLSSMALSGMSMDMPDLSESSMPDFSSLISFGDLNLDLSDAIDPEEILKELPADQVPDMSEALKSVKFDFTEEKATALLKDVLEGYQESIQDKPEADLSKMQSAIQQFLSSSEVNDRLSADIEQLVNDNIKVDVSTEKMIAAAVKLMNQYQEYARANGIEKADAASILGFLSQSDIQQQIRQEANELIQGSVTVTITADQIKELLMKDVIQAYPEYAKANQLPDPANLGTYFVEYMQSEDGQNRLMKGLTSMIDTSEAEKQFSSAMETYMTNMMTAFSDAITKAIESKFTDVMSQVETQLTQGIQTAMEQMMGSISDSMQGALQSVMTSVTSSITTAMSPGNGTDGKQYGKCLCH